MCLSTLPSRSAISSNDGTRPDAKVVHTHQDAAAQWLRERRDLAERRESIGLVVNIALLVFIFWSMVLGIIPRSRHDPKILGRDDAEVVGDGIAEVRPIARNLFAQETERRVGELRTGCVAFVVRNVSVHQAP